MTEPTVRARLVTTPGGRIFVDEGDTGTVARALLSKGRYEEKWTRWLQGVVRPGMHALDVGANVGYYTALLAQLVGPDGRVVACEPDPHNCSLLRRTVAENGFTNVEVLDAAVSHRVGRATLYQDQAAHGVHSLGQRNIVNAGSGRVDVATVTIDALIAGRGHGFDLIKLDAQGAEGRILAAAGQLLAQPHALVLIEIWPHGLATFGDTVESIVEPFVQQGFASYTFGAGRVWAPIAPAAIAARAATLGTWSSFNLAWVK
jgi:FkbM family methyltransferase